MTLRFIFKSKGSKVRRPRHLACLDRLRDQLPHFVHVTPPGDAVALTGPVVLQVMGLSTSIALITFAAIHPYWGATWEEQLQLMVLATTLAATLTNLLYLEPKTTQVGYYVSALEMYPEYSFSIGLVGKDSCVR